MLVIANVAKAYGKVRALADVSLTVGAGEAVLLVGRNGAGKTTLLRIATGYLDADAGSVTIDGVSIERDRAKAQQRLGYLPEHAPAPPELTVREHLKLRAGQKRAAGVDAVMAAVSIEAEADRLIGTLSKGFRQRVGLADALLGEPKLLVLDEPTSGMDPIQTRQLCDYLVAAAKQRAVLVSSHAVADLEPLAARVAVLREGKLLADATPAALLAQTGAARLNDAVVKLLGDA